MMKRDCSRRRLGLCFGLLVAVMCLLPATLKAEEKPPIIAVASNLRFAIEDVAKSFEEDSGLSVRFSFGSSANLARQLLQGAPFEMFMSADESYVFRVSDAGLAMDRGKIYGFGRIVTFIRPGSPLGKAAFPGDYAAVLGKQSQPRFAIANPMLAPYGRAARQALEFAGLWRTIKPYLIYGQNISQAAQFSLSGSTLGGIIAYSLALSPPFRENGTYQLIPVDWHSPLAQRMVLVAGAGDTAKRFYDFISRPKARAIFARYGFANTPGEP